MRLLLYAEAVSFHPGCCRANYKERAVQETLGESMQFLIRTTESMAKYHFTIFVRLLIRNGVTC